MLPRAAWARDVRPPTKKRSRNIPPPFGTRDVLIRRELLNEGGGGGVKSHWSSKFSVAAKILGKLSKDR